MIKKFIEKTIDKFLAFKSFQDYINNRYKSVTSTIVQITPDAYYWYKGFFYILSDQLGTIQQVYGDYRFTDIRSEDIVLDIGANIGAFTFEAAKKAKWVYAVEPLHFNELEKNLEKNNITNVTVLPVGLGNKNTELNIKYGVKQCIVKCYNLSEIITLCGGHVDFLKIDCEGGEWNITESELKGIRRIEAEIHADKKHSIKDFEILIKSFNYEIDHVSEDIMLLHASTKNHINVLGID